MRDASGRREAPVGDGTLWAGVLVAPAAWAAALLVGYALTRTGEPCAATAAAALAAVTAVAGLVAAGGTLVARRSWVRLRDAPAPAGSGRDDERDGGVREEREGSEGSDGGEDVARAAARLRRAAHERRRLMAHGGMILGALATTIVVGHGVALLVLGPCR